MLGKILGKQHVACRVCTGTQAPFAEIEKRRPCATFPFTSPVPSRWRRECKPSGLRPLLGPNLRGKILPRSHRPRIQRRSCLVLQECVLLRRCTLPSTSSETQPHLPSRALLFSR